MNCVELGLKLREQGYDIRIAGGCLDLFADRYYLINEVEAKAIADYTERHGKVEDFSPYMTKNGLSYWLNHDRLFLSAIEEEILRELGQESMHEAIASLYDWDSFNEDRKKRLVQLARESMSIEKPWEIFVQFASEVQQKNPEYQGMIASAFQEMEQTT